MKDKNNIELVRGDIVMVIIDTPVEKPTELVVYLEMEEETTGYDSNDNAQTKTTRNLKYYPITDEGLEVAKYDADATLPKLYRTEKFIYTNIESRHLLKMPTSSVRGYKKELYDSIVALL